MIAKDEKINVVVPTGNFGNILAAFYAKNMGLPIAKLICASNENKVLFDFFSTGTYDKNREFILTSSPSMDILISSNLERFLYYGTKESTNEVKKLMESLNTKGSYDFKNPFDYFYAYSTDEKKTLEVIKEVYDQYKYLVDPHTAVAYNAYKKYSKETGDDSICVVISTASPYKFPQSVLEAFDIEESDAFKAIHTLSKKFNLEIPKVLNYPKVEREIISLKDSNSYVEEVVKCLESK